ncbi:hypothetical protein JEQ21_07790 [Streptococcus sp. 121]|uniref:hypothetical protein n=1 Tax=Streptococcus sp. 121 TaxID=2797637 RepID=UPI0018F085DA|nr:hypothetical protein [Streptococcus sp. 121]MBJ6746355.1 hypothetical protein [Streptococcus sp. 121]
MNKKNILGVALLASLFMGSASATDKNEKAYQEVLEDYEKIARVSVNRNGDAEAVANELYGKLNQDLSYWTIANIAQSPDKLLFSYHDIDQKGENELLVGMSDSQGNIYPIALHYLDDGEPELLAETYVAAVGGDRVGFVLYKDGSVLQSAVSSGFGRGQATLYELDPKGGEAKKVEEQAIQLGQSDIHSQFGHTEDQILEMDVIDWVLIGSFDTKTSSSSTQKTKQSQSSQKSETTSSSTTQSGSVYDGKWVSQRFGTMSIKDNTLTTSDGTYTMHHKGLGNWTLAENRVSAVEYNYVPVNVPIPGYESDETRERIYLKPQYEEPQEDFEKGIYYRDK